MPLEKRCWNEILGNPYQVNPNAEMVTGEFLKSTYRAIKGESKSNVYKMFVSYNREYVISWLVKKLIVPLGVHTNETKYNEFQKLISDAIKKAKSEN